MSSPSSTSSSSPPLEGHRRGAPARESAPGRSLRRSLVLGALLLGVAFALLARSSLPAVAYFGGKKLAEKHEKLAALEREHDVDVVFVGPSFVDQGIDAELFGRLTGETAFNLGVSGTDLYLQALYVRDVVIPVHRPRAILWGTRDSTLTRSAINYQYLRAPALEYAHSLLGARGFRLGLALPHFRKRRIEDWIALLRPGAETLDAWGQTELASATRPPRDAAGAEGEDGEDGDGPAAQRSFLRDDFSVGLEEARAVFADTLRFARERGVRVVFFLTPYHESVFARRTSYARLVLTGEFDEYYRWLTATLAAHDVPLVNLRHCAEVSTRPECFYDSRHLNAIGAAPTSEILARIHTGERAILDEWSGLPSRAELAAMLGTGAVADVPLLSGARFPLAAARLVETPQGKSAYARLAVERGGTYRLVFSDPRAEGRGAYYVRLGGGPYREWRLSGERAPSVTLPGTFELAAGEVLLEIHAQTRDSPLERGELLLAPADAPPGRPTDRAR